MALFFVGVFAGPGPLPGWKRAGIGGRTAVWRNDTVYLFTRPLFFDASSRNGLVLGVPLALAGSGLAVPGTAVRRDMTPRH